VRGLTAAGADASPALPVATVFAWTAVVQVVTGVAGTCSGADRRALVAEVLLAGVPVVPSIAVFVTRGIAREVTRSVTRGITGSVPEVAGRRIAAVSA
jgi:hypothetical protein